MTLYRVSISVACLHLATASAKARTPVRIDWGDIDVIPQGDQARSVAGVLAVKNMNGTGFAIGACRIFEGNGPSRYANSAKVHITQGNLKLDAETQAGQQ